MTKKRTTVAGVIWLCLSAPVASADVLQAPNYSTIPGQKGDFDLSGIQPEFQLPAVSPSILAPAMKNEGQESLSFRGAEGVEIYKKIAPSVVLLLTKTGSGTGGIITEDGLIVTNWHVVEGFEYVAAIFKPAGLSPKMEDAEAIAAQIIMVDQKRDLALLQLLKSPSVAIEPIALGSITALEIGQDTHAIGHPSGLTWTYTRGFISSYRPEHIWNYENSEHQANVIQTQTPINPGNSGGPLLNNSGQLIGINSYTSEGEGLSFSVSVEEVEFLKNSLPDDYKIKLNNCENALLVFYGRNETDEANLETYDRDCNGIVDAIHFSPDDAAEPIFVILDDNENGNPDGYIYDENRDGAWDISYWDTSGDGEMDTSGNHPNGDLYPTSYN